jgi:hypothetical protein
MPHPFNACIENHMTSNGACLVSIKFVFHGLLVLILLLVKNAVNNRHANIWSLWYST